MNMCVMSEQTSEQRPSGLVSVGKIVSCVPFAIDLQHVIWTAHTTQSNAHNTAGVSHANTRRDWKTGEKHGKTKEKSNQKGERSAKEEKHIPVRKWTVQRVGLLIQPIDRLLQWKRVTESKHLRGKPRGGSGAGDVLSEASIYLFGRKIATFEGMRPCFWGLEFPKDPPLVHGAMCTRIVTCMSRKNFNICF